MNFTINSLNTSLIGLSSKYTRDINQVSVALEGMFRNRNEHSKERSLNNALTTFADKTRTFYQSLNSFDFPSGYTPNHFRTASVSDSNKIAAQATSGAKIADYQVKIDRLATTQIKRSNVLVSDETTDFSEGTYAFTLTVNGTDYSLNIDIDKSGSNPDTNKDVLRKLAWAIGHGDDSIEAFVTETERKGYITMPDSSIKEVPHEKVSYLTVRNASAGGTTFSLSDDTGTMIETLNINNSSQRDQAGEYYLDNALSTTNTNTVTADNGHLTMTFLDTTEVPVNVTVKGGLKPVQEKLYDMVSTYNSYISWLDQNSRYINSTVKTGIMEEIKPISRNLREIGLEYNTGGTVSITNKFNPALQSSMRTVKETLTGTNGFFTKVEAKLAEMSRNGVQKYGLVQDGSIYGQQGVVTSLFANYKGTSGLDLYA